MKKFVILLCIAILSSFSAKAQKFSVGTNLVEWATYGTANLDFGFSIARHFSVALGGCINPWDFSKGDDFAYCKDKTAYAGIRYWPWYVFSGLWIQAKGQYKNFSNTGLWRPALDEGTGVGAGLALGYTLMIHEKFNIEFGAGGWGGKLTDHTLYCCPKDMEIRETGPKWFADLDEVSVALMFIF